MIIEQHQIIAFALTVIAGLATIIGGSVSFFVKRSNLRMLAIGLGFSAGVMIYVSMIEIFPQAQQILSSEVGAKQGNLLTIIAFFVGMFLIGFIDKLIPSDHNPHEVKKVDGTNEGRTDQSSLMRIGIFTALAVGIHNFPEGLATFVSALQAPTLAIPIVVAIAIHNIPEGIAVSVPIYYATGDKKKAFIYSFASGLSEPIGALVGYLILMPIMNDIVYGVLFAGVAGIMVFISLDELLPSAREYGEHHLSIYGLIGGMIIMAMSLWLFM